jgi:hypothetical protein
MHGMYGMYAQFLILEGRLGTGREEAALWLKRYCNMKGLRVLSVRLSKAGECLCGWCTAIVIVVV